MVKLVSEGRGRGQSFGRNPRDEGPPDEIVEVGEILHSSEENQLLCKSTIDKVPWFSKSVYLESKAEIGKVDEVLGPVTDFMFSVQVDPNMKAESFEKGTKVFMSPSFLFNMNKFTEPAGGGRGGRGGRGRGGARGRGFSGGRGASRGFSGGRPGGRSFSGARGAPRGNWRPRR